MGGGGGARRGGSRSALRGWRPCSPLAGISCSTVIPADEQCRGASFQELEDLASGHIWPDRWSRWQWGLAAQCPSHAPPPGPHSGVSPPPPPQPVTSSLVRTPTPGPAPPHPPISLPACWPPSFLTGSSVGPGRAQGYGPALAPPDPPRAASGPLWAGISPTRCHLGPRLISAGVGHRSRNWLRRRWQGRKLLLSLTPVSRLISWPFVLPGYAKTSLVGPGDAHLSSKGRAGPGHESSSPHPSGTQSCLGMGRWAQGHSGDEALVLQRGGAPNPQRNRFGGLGSRPKEQHPKAGRQEGGPCIPPKTHHHQRG